MFKSNLLNKNLRVELIDSKKFIFDQVRKKKVIMTPEEWVRQSIIFYLVKTLKYPLGLISVESSLKYNNINKRSDIIVKSRQGLNNYLLVECKSFKLKPMLTIDSVDVTIINLLSCSIKFKRLKSNLSLTSEDKFSITMFS